MRRLRRWRRGAGALLLLLGTGLSAACEVDEAPVFRCEAAGGAKFIELCASMPVGSASGHLQYRFGSQGGPGAARRPELVFPGQLAGSLGRFYGSTYTVAGVYTQSIRFQTAQASYAVFTESRAGATIAAGVRVKRLGTGATTTVSCSERPRFYLHGLERVLACDPDTPVGRACIR